MSPTQRFKSCFFLGFVGLLAVSNCDHAALQAEETKVNRRATPRILKKRYITLQEAITIALQSADARPINLSEGTTEVRATFSEGPFANLSAKRAIHILLLDPTTQRNNAMAVLARFDKDWAATSSDGGCFMSKLLIGISARGAAILS